MPKQNMVDTRPILHHGTCPSCGKSTAFDLLGIQRWPEKIAEQAGFSTIQTVWQCQNCDTTLMEQSLSPDKSA